MLEMAILDIQIFKIFCGSMPPDPPRKLAPLALVGVRPPPPLISKSWIRPCKCEWIPPPSGQTSSNMPHADQVTNRIGVCEVGTVSKISDGQPEGSG